LQLLDGLKLGASSVLTEFVRQKREELGLDIEKHRKWETEHDKDRDERFE